MAIGNSGMPKRNRLDKIPYWDLLYLMAQYRKSDLFDGIDANINASALEHGLKQLRRERKVRTPEKREQTIAEARRINPKLFSNLT